MADAEVIIHYIKRLINIQKASCKNNTSLEEEIYRYRCLIEEIKQSNILD